MSKWIDKDLFNKYVENKEKEQEDSNKTFIKRSENVWQTPAAGSATQPEIYEGRFLPDPENVFTSKYYYHFWKSGDKYNNIFCPKTWDFNNYCPICSLTNKLYMGTLKDKSLASNMKRKARHVSNFYIVSDPRDLKILEPEKKATGKNKIYEFPDKVDAKIKLQLLDRKEGLGSDIFDPGEDGHNFILRIKSTKPDGNGKTYPDYSDSDFSRKPSSIGTDKQIKDIMEKRYNLNSYIKSLETTMERTVEVLKNEMLYDLVKDEIQKILPDDGGVKVEAADKHKKEETADVTAVQDVPDNIGDDDDLLRELENMK